MLSRFNSNREGMAMAHGDRDLVKEQFWRGMLGQWEGSKQTVRDFCAEHGLSEQCFYSWRRTIAQRDQQASPARRRAMPAARSAILDTQADDLPAFVPVKVAAPMPNPVLEVVVGPGRIIRVPADFDAVALRRLVHVLEESSPC
jgi:hypothetical protein